MAYKVTYFDQRGRAEPIRLILVAGGAGGTGSFIDNRITKEEWLTLKETTPWGEIPLLDEDDKRLAQTNTICRYLGRKFNLIGMDEWEAAKCDEYVDSMSDFFFEWAKYFFGERDEEKKKQLREEFHKTLIPKYLGKFNTLIEKNGGNWLVGKDMTWSDIFIAERIDMLQKFEGPNILDAYPFVNKLKENVYATPKIKAYLEQRADTSI